MTDLDVAKTKQEEERKLLAARELGQAVKQRLKELRWVQQDLAEELNTSQSVVSSIVAGTYLLTLDLITRLAKALKLPPITLASYYWKNEELEISQQNDEVIERIRDLLTEYYQIGRQQSLTETTPTPTTEKQPARPNRKYPLNKKALDAPEIENQKIMEENPNPSMSSMDIQKELESN